MTDAWNHVGLVKEGDAVRVQVRNEKDTLCPEVWEYLGQRCVTKDALIQTKDALLVAINDRYKRSFTTIIIDWEGEEWRYTLTQAS